MLFDLRSRGRKNTVRIIYTTLALLMGGGLVLFGIGGATSGGLLDAFKGNSTSTSDIFKKRVTAAERQVRVKPQDPAAWANLARVRYQQAGTGDGYDQATSQFTKSGLKELQGVENAWTKYLSLDPKHPDDSTALLMVQALGPGGLNHYDQAVRAMEIVIQQRKPSSGTYGQYAELAYLAGQDRKGDLAAKKAVSLAPKAQRAQVKTALDQAKTQAAQQAAQQAQQSTG
jgi:hypothetical protein